MMQHTMIDAMGRWFQTVRNCHSGVIVVALVSALTVTACVPVSAAQGMAKPTPTEVAEIVLCIGVVRNKAGGQHAFFQRGGNTIEQTLTEQGMAALIDDGFTVEHRNCYESWQAAADFLTDGAVALPDNATEQDFAQALLEWQQRR